MQQSAAASCFSHAIANRHPVRIVGIVNITPDSFSGDGLLSNNPTATLTAQIKHANKLVAEGADILDIGGESTRPTAKPVLLEEEWSRISPLLRSLKRDCPTIPISIDTYKAEIARRAMEEGADMVNDISCGRDPAMFSVMAKYKKAYILTHNQPSKTVRYDCVPLTDLRVATSPLPSSERTTSSDISALYPQDSNRSPQVFIDHVLTTFRHRINATDTLGIDRSQLILDPGFGFAKTYEENFILFSILPLLLEEHKLPLMVGISRKSFVSLTTDLSDRSRLGGTIAGCLYAVSQGACYFRVHDVAEVAGAIALHKAILDAKSTMPRAC